MNNRFCNKFNIYYPLNTFFSAFLILLSVFFLISCQIPHQAPVTATAWVGTWGAAQQLVEPHNLPPIPGLNNNTLRQVVRVSIGGEQLRVRFSNEYSTSPVILKSVHIAASTGRSAIDPETDAALSFGGKKMTVIDPGATAISDPCHFLLKPRSD
ncbi:MAG: SGNH/GDSL hydrolase family protein, partial [Deltaproteobacteria bacterium]|nr:SGNH/GDSL hydrolase family protein [Deltaproteobacteria bacterium]